MAKKSAIKAIEKEDDNLKEESTDEIDIFSLFSEKIKSLDSTKDKIAIFTHDTPDPDSMGSAAGIQWILSKSFKIQSDIFYNGDVSHPQNKTMVNILNLNMRSFSDFKKDDYQLKIAVDCTEKNCPVKDLDIVFDHHRIQSSAPISQIVPLGSTCTLIWELIKNLELEFNEDIEQDVATALFVGVRVDTNELISENTTDRDFEAFKGLSYNINRKKLASIIDYPLPNYFFELEKELNKTNPEGKYTNQKTDGSCFVGCVGIISPTKRDSIPMLADKTVRMEGIETTVIFGLVQDSIISSIRSHNTSLDVNSFAQNIFGREHAGGKLGYAGANVPLGIMGVSDSPDQIKKIIWEAIKEKIFYKVIHVATGN